MTEACFSSPNSLNVHTDTSTGSTHLLIIIKLTQHAFLLMMSDDVSDLCDRPGGSRMAVNSRIMRVDQSFLLEDVLAACIMGR